MNLFRRQEPRLEDAIAAIAQRQRVEPITFADRFAAICDALDGAEEAEVAGAIRALLSLITDRTLRCEVLRAVQDDTWGDVQ